jgi:hypothetical protein
MTRQRTYALAALGLMYALVIAAAILAGCSTTTGPTPNPVAAPAQAAIASSEAAKVAIRAAVPETSPKGKVSLAVAVEHTDAAIAAGKQAVEAAKDQGQDLSKAQQALQDERTAREQDKIAAQERWQKEHDASEWIGWRIRAIAAYFLGTLAGLVILTVITGVAGTIFPAVWPLLSVVYSALKTVIGLITLGAGRIAPALQWLDDRFDGWIEARRAKLKPEVTK